MLSATSVGREVQAKGISPAAEDRLAHLHTLQWRILILLILASLIPLAVISTGAWIVFGRIISDKSITHLQTIVRDHAATIDLFLQERLMALDLVGQTYTRDQIIRPAELQAAFQNLNQSYTNSFLDLGVIDQNGDHLTYLGPYELWGKNYQGASWFDHVSREGTYISDVFLGVRNVPHFIVAVRKAEGDGRFWILRATINSEVFSQLVSKGRLGATGDCFLIDRFGRYQTPPLSGAQVLDPSDVGGLRPGEDIQTVALVSADGRKIIRTIKWIKHGEWALVAQQEESELNASFRAAMAKGMAVFALGAVLIVLASFSVTRYLFRLIERTTEQKEKLTTQLLQASKLASLGEMATGLAHEINNPLAIIVTEQTNLTDLLCQIPAQTPEIEEMLESTAMIKKHVMRCKAITQKMLQFGRQHRSAGSVLEPGTQLAEIIKLMKPQARVNNVDLYLSLAPELPKIYIDPTELQQVVVNLINNAVSAIQSHGAIIVSAWREGRRFRLTVEDTGPGIPDAIKEKIFEPFFTTKPVGQGTGLGLSVCYGIVVKWRGKIWLESRSGAGTGAKFVIEFPVAEETAPA